jgi:hypothetical protein
MAKKRRPAKTIYRIQIEHDMQPVYYHTQAEADRAWNNAEEPLEFVPVDPVAECEELHRIIESQHTQINRLVYALSELLEVTPIHVIADRPEGRLAHTTLREHSDGVAEDIDRDVAEYKEQQKKGK